MSDLDGIHVTAPPPFTLPVRLYLRLPVWARRRLPRLAQRYEREYFERFAWFMSDVLNAGTGAMPSAVFPAARMVIGADELPEM